MDVATGANKWLAGDGHVQHERGAFADAREDAGNAEGRPERRAAK
jgi:hypothetical protein